MKQRQFLDVVSAEEAHRILREAFRHLTPKPQAVPLDQALGRVLCRALRAAVDVPGFDRSNMDGFAVRAEDTFGATEREARRLEVVRGSGIAAGSRPGGDGPVLAPGQAIEIATGAVLPRGADAVVMIEDTAPVEGSADADTGSPAIVEVFRPVTPGENISGTGSDIGRGEIVLQAGRRLTSRETALAAAVGAQELICAQRPRALVLSTGDEIRPPGARLALGEIYDSNGRVLCDALTEQGALATFGGILPDDEERLHSVLEKALEREDAPDLILLSGGTSKGKGDLNARVLERLAHERGDSRGILLHGVALKPGKPICIAEISGRPVAVLPGFPTSAIFTFHEFLSPLLKRMTGEVRSQAELVQARLPRPLRSMAGRTEYLLVDLVPGPEGPTAYPLGAGSGSVSTFSRADGYIRIPRHVERLDRDQDVAVRPIAARPQAADLVAIGSHCVGLEYLLGRLMEQGFACKGIPVGSMAGLKALEWGEGDLAGCHLLDATSNTYNRPFLPPGTTIIGGYGRRQGLVFRPGDARFEGLGLAHLVREVVRPSARMINRNRGSGTRVLLDELLGTARPPGYTSESKSHHAVAAAVAQGRADWGLTLDVLAQAHGLAFVFLRQEHFELVVRNDRRDRPALIALENLLNEEETRAELGELGFHPLRAESPQVR